MAECKQCDKEYCLIDNLCDDCIAKLCKCLFHRNTHTIELNITGLAGASSADVHRMAEELATSLTQKIRMRRRN